MYCRHRPGDQTLWSGVRGGSFRKPGTPAAFWQRAFCLWCWFVAPLLLVGGGGVGGGVAVQGADFYRAEACIFQSRFDLAAVAGGDDDELVGVEVLLCRFG